MAKQEQAETPVPTVEIERIVAEYLKKALPPLVEAAVPPMPAIADADIAAKVRGYLDANLAELVKAAQPETPEQTAERERETLEQATARQRKADAARLKREQKAAERAAAEAAAKRVEQEQSAAEAFARAAPFTGKVADVTPAILRGIAVDDGSKYSVDHQISVRASELEPTADGGLLLTKAIELPARGEEFAVVAVSLVTDAGVLRTELGGTRKCGGGRAVSFPARSLVFRPARAAPETE